MPTPKATTIQLTVTQFRDLVEPVLPLAGRDDALPVLTTLLIQAKGDTITATATDRFRVGISRLKLNEPVKDAVVFMIRTYDVKRVLNIFKGSRYDDPALAFTLTTTDMDARIVEVRSTEGFDGLASASIAFSVPDGEYPKIVKLFTESLTGEGDRVDSFALNAAFLADFKAAVRDRQPLMVRPAGKEGQGVLVACGDHFIGLIMPRRLISESGGNPVKELAASWADILPIKADSEAVA